MKLRVKLVDGSTDGVRDRVCAHALAIGATRAEAMFPDHATAALRELIALDAPDDDADALVDALAADADVQFVERDAPRHLAADE